MLKKALFIKFMFYNINILTKKVILMENLTFDEAISKLEGILDEIESGDLDTETSEVKLEEAEALKDYCQKLLEEEKAAIEKLAEENGISLEDLELELDEEENNNN